MTARAMLHCAIGDRFFTDFLTLIKLEGRWQVISKVFHYKEMG
ncbi:MAG: nuclear transport factor 2 family protein [Tabrizicola sp.]